MRYQVISVLASISLCLCSVWAKDETVESIAESVSVSYDSFSKVTDFMAPSKRSMSTKSAYVNNVQSQLRATYGDDGNLVFTIDVRYVNKNWGNLNRASSQNGIELRVIAIDTKVESSNAGVKCIELVRIPISVSLLQSASPDGVAFRVYGVGDVLTLRFDEAYVKGFLRRVGMAVSLPGAQSSKVDASKYVNYVDCKALDVIPKMVKGSGPAYPKSLSRKGVEGWCTLRFFIDENGVVREWEAVATTDERFVPGCGAAVAAWVFTPGMKDSKNVTTAMTQTFFFTLK